MTHIVILFNRSQQELSQALSESKLAAWLGLARVETLASANAWSKLDHLLGLPHTPDSQVLKLTPVRVELGMRDSLCHLLTDKNALITQQQISEFNDFFTGVFRLLEIGKGNYQLHFEQFFKFNLPIQHWPPNLSDYRVQIQASSDGLKSHLTELQSWCYHQNSLWNAFYLWPRPTDKSLEQINLDDRSKAKVFSKLNVFNQAKVHADVRLVIADEFNSLAFDLMKIEQQLNNSSLEKLTISFTDDKVYHIRPRDFYPWWKKIFIR